MATMQKEFDQFNGNVEYLFSNLDKLNDIDELISNSTPTLFNGNEILLNGLIALGLLEIRLKFKLIQALINFNNSIVTATGDNKQYLKDFCSDFIKNKDEANAALKHSLNLKLKNISGNVAIQSNVSEVLTDAFFEIDKRVKAVKLYLYSKK